MSRFGQWFAWALLGSMFSGCGGGGLDEGMSKEIPKDAMSAETKAFAEQNRKNMSSLRQGKPKNAPASPPATSP
jgi:hypothetical protein